jgi:hypothetical protein
MGRQPTLIQIAPELEREGRVGQGVAIPGSDGLAEAAGAIAGEFSKTAAQVSALADHAAQVEGNRDGSLAGMDPEFRFRRDGTIRGEAFDRAAKDTALARSRVAISEEIEAASTKHRADPATLRKVLGEKAKAWTAGAEPELLPEIKNLFATGSAAAFKTATRELWAEQAAAQRASMQEELARTLRQTQQMAYAGGLDEGAVAAAAGNVDALQKALTRRGPDGKRLVDPEEASKLVLAAKTTVARAQLEGAFDRLPSIEAKQAFVQKLDEDFGKGDGAAQIFDFNTYQSVRGHLDSQMRKDASAARQQNTVLAHMVSEVERRATSGEPVRQDEVAQLRGAVASQGGADLQAKLDDALHTLDYQQNLKNAPLGQIQVEVDRLRRDLEAEPASLTDRGRTGRRLKAAEALLSQAEKQVANDPLAWDNRVGMIQLTPLSQVDIRQPAAIEGWGASRIAQADEVAARHALPRPVYLRAEEKRFLGRAFEQGGDSGLAVITAVRNAFGDRTEAVLAEIGREAPGGVLLADLALKTGNTPAVTDAAAGYALRTQKGYKPLAPAKSLALKIADDVTDRSLGFAAPYLQKAMKVADAIYEQRAHREGKIEAFQEDIWKQALKEAFGEHVRADGRTYGGLVRPGGGWFGSHRIVLPPSIPQDKAPDIFAAIRPEDLGEAMGGGPRGTNGKPLGRGELALATYVTLEPGKYLLAMGDVKTSNPKWAKGPDGKAYVLDIEAVLPSIKRRRPDLR